MIDEHKGNVVGRYADARVLEILSAGTTTNLCIVPAARPVPARSGLPRFARLVMCP